MPCRCFMAHWCAWRTKEAIDTEIKELRKKAMALPLTPGIYIMKNNKGKVIYVGKAKKLKNRVSQYFGSQNTHTVKVKKMVENVCDFDYILCDSEFEALVLECSLIKQYSPKYNILLKDDKGYSYIKITQEAWPKISAVKMIRDDGAKYIGPYISSFSVTSSVDEALKIFMLPQCNKSFPKEIGKSRPCLNFFIKQCMAPCSGKISCEEYNNAVNDAVNFLKNSDTDILKKLSDEMLEASENLEFEKAARLRDRIRAIKKVGEKQKVVGFSTKDTDIFAVVQSEEKACLSVLRFSSGRLKDNQYFIIDTIEDMPSARSELITGFYSMGRAVPKQIFVDGEIADNLLLEAWLSDKAGKKVDIIVPKIGEHQKIIEMCRSNASEKLAQSLGRTGGVTSQLDELTRLLKLKKAPVYIESYDISHTSGSDNVAGMVVFKNGLPYKTGYRRFAIKGFSGQDDYASMAEVISRRFNEYEENKGTNNSFGILPDLILLDGGKGQLNAVLPIIEAFGYDIPVFGMVKDNKHRTRAIATNGGEVAINSKRQAFTLVSSIQEEVHRFSVAYHRNKHKKSTIGTSLINIDGIGEKKSKALLKHFKTISAIKNAKIDELCKVEGINKAQAEKVYEYFQKKVDN